MRTELLASDGKLGRAAAIGRAVMKGLMLTLALVFLLLPDSRLGRHSYLFLFGIPLILAAVRNRQDRIFVAWAVYALSFVVFVILRTIAGSFGFPVQYDYVIRVDRVLGFGEIPTIRLQHWLNGSVVAPLLDWGLITVHLSYYAVPPLAGLLLWWLDERRFIRYAAAIGMAYLIGAGIHIVLPTAPPWYSALDGLIRPVHRVLYDVLHGLSPSFYSYGYKVAAGNEVAAMPSLHFTATLLVAVALNPFASCRRVGWCYTGLMGLGLVYLGEHYVADLIVGAGLALGCWHLAGRLKEVRAE